MHTKTLQRCFYYLKASGICIVVVGGCCTLYQLRQTSQILRSAVNTSVLDLEQKHAQYIYLDDPRFKDILLARNKEDLHTSILDKPRSLSHVISKWWKSLNRTVAYRLLEIAQNGDKNERMKAVYSLSCLEHLKDWHYQYIAQKLDARTAISLARMPNVDLRFFLKPPYSHIRHKLYDMVEKLHYFLLELDKKSESRHPCLTQFLNKKFKASLRDSLIFDHDLTNVGLAVPSTVAWDQDLLKNCVEALHHHSSLEEHCKGIISAGGLALLMDVKKMLPDDTDVCVTLAKILSNLSLHTEYLEEIFRSGWIRILVEWSHHVDVRLSAPASRALANLDIDDAEHVIYPPRIYLLHPLHKVQSPAAKLDVVFIHGLLGGVFVTWRQRDLDPSLQATIDSTLAATYSSDVLSTMIEDHPQEFLQDLAYDLKVHEWKKLGQDYEIIFDDCPENVNCRACGPFSCNGDAACVDQAINDRLRRTQCWPKDWLPEDVPSLRVIGINYDTNLSMWTPLCPIEGLRSTMDERSEEFVKKLATAGIGRKPVIWVCHSMGGLLVKKMLTEEWKSGDRNALCRNTKGIIFYSTPHRGSHVAALRNATQMLVWPSVEVQELRRESPKLLKLHEEFLEMLKTYKIDVVSFAETKPTLVTALKFPFQFVTSDSADPGVGEFFEIPQDHLSICKPANRQSFLYQKVLSIIKKHVKDYHRKMDTSTMEEPTRIGAK